MSAPNKNRTAPAECPVCGADVPPRAKACPECGADERSGWNEAATRYDGLDLPDDAFDDDEGLKDEGVRKRIPAKGVAIFWWVVGFGLAGTLVYSLLVRRF